MNKTVIGWIEFLATLETSSIKSMHQPTDHFQGIPAFVQAVECGSFSVASRRMGLSPSSVGKAVARLEQRLGVQLFQRTTRRLSLTDEGADFYESCLRAVSELDRATGRARDSRRQPAGRVRIALPSLYGRVRVMPVLIASSQSHPELDLDVLFSSRAVDLIEEGFDLAVRIGRLDSSATHVARRLGEQALMLSASPAYLRQHGTPATLDELAQHTCIARLREGRHEAWQFREGAMGSSRLPQNARFRFSDFDAVKEAALAGLGLAQLPAWFISDALRAGRLRPVLPEWQPPPLPIHVLWARTTRMSARMRVVIDALADGCG
jgi:DNA-binding transcriptional LysR family regulator